MSVKVARLAVETNLFPLYEVENGIRYTLNHTGSRPVKDYLAVQGRFGHLEEKDINTIQEMVNEDWELLKKKIS